MLQFYRLNLPAEHVGWLLAVAKQQVYEQAAPVIERIAAQVADQERAKAVSEPAE